MPYYRIKYSDNSGTYKVIESVSFVHQDAEDWAQYKEQLQAVKRHIHGLKPEKDRIQVWKFEEIKGVAGAILYFLNGE